MKQHPAQLTFFIGTILLSTQAFSASHHPADFLASLKGDKQANAKVYQHYCSLCHDKTPRIAVKAPRIGVIGDWNERRKKGLAGIFHQVDEGLGAMPPRGGCFECSDALLKETIQYMLPKTDHHP